MRILTVAGLFCLFQTACPPPDGDPCKGIECGQHGRCRDLGGSAVCECELGWHDQAGRCVPDVDAALPDATLDAAPDAAPDAALDAAIDAAVDAAVDAAAPACGNDVAESGEMCDGDDLRGATCASRGFTGGGTLGCRAGCRYYDTSGCVTSCGDGLMGGDEQCDEADFQGETCETLGYYTGTLTCTVTCTLDRSGCAGRCGDGVIQVGPGEECDASNLAGDTCESLGFYSGTLTCGNDCRFDVTACSGYCGDSEIQPADGEVCDGPDLGGETCLSLGYMGGLLACAGDCQSFDPGGCTTPLCGNGRLEPGEQCDDGDTLPGDGCTASCQEENGWECLGEPSTCETICGDGLVAGAEACDEAGMNGTYGHCNAGCTGPGERCGDGLINGTETCDGSRLGGHDCTTIGQGYSGGSLACTPTCDGWNVALCSGAIVDPTTLAPGETKVVTGGAATFRDLFRSGAGSLLVTTDLPEWSGNRVSRSTDNGATWSTIDLGIAGQDIQGIRVFPIDATTIGITSSQQSGSPYDAHLRYTTDDGLTYSPSWVDVSNSGDLNGPKNFTTIIRASDGTFVAVIPWTGLYSRKSTTLESWPDPRTPIVTGANRSCPSLVLDGNRILLVDGKTDAAFELWESLDQGTTFSLVSTTPTPDPFAVTKMWRSPSTGALFLCGATARLNQLDEHVYTYRSDDGGATWTDEKVHLRNIDRADRSTVSCHVDETGVYVGYQDLTTNEIRVVLPGNPVDCGNGVVEPGETCDGSDLDGQTCVGQGFGGGTLACSPDCGHFVTTGCSAAAYPVSCAQVASTMDGNYTIDPDGAGPHPPFEVYCADLGTSEPKAYLNLQVTGGGNNYSYWIYTSGGTEATCHYSRVRFADVQTLLLDGHDQRFATCVGNSTYFAAANWGEAQSCMCGGCTHGTMNIDLTGTPFKIDLDGGAGWEVTGWVQAGGVTRNEGPGIIVEANGGGYCGGTFWKNPPGPILAFTTPSPCGDGVISPPGEICDGTNLDGNDCTTIGSSFTGGTLACNSACTGWNTSACTSSGTGRTFTPGATKVVTGTQQGFGGVLHTPDDTLLVGSFGTAWVGEIWVSRSTDGGDTWNTTNLGNAYGNHTYYSRLFMIDEDTVGVTGGQGTNSPYDQHLRYSANDGLSWNGSWINVSNSGDLWGNKSWGAVMKLPTGSYLGVYDWNDVYGRVSSSLETWGSTTRSKLTTTQGYGFPALATVGNEVHFVTFRNLAFETWVSTDNGQTFSQRSSTSTTAQQDLGAMWHDQDTGIQYLCATPCRGSDISVVYYTSEDGGVTWSEPTAYVSGIDQYEDGSGYGGCAHCHVDESGIYVGYRDLTSGEVRVILPQQAVCGNGILEAGEVCDGSNLDGASCTAVSTEFTGGTLSCNASCGGWVTTGCECPGGGTPTGLSCSSGWTAGEPLAQARQGHTATLLPSGSVLVAAGYTSGSNRVTSAEVYDSQTGHWAGAGTLNTGSIEARSAVLSDGKVLHGGGDNSASPPYFTTSCERYDPDDGSWTPTGALLASRAGPAMLSRPTGEPWWVGGMYYIGDVYTYGSRASTEYFQSGSWHPGPVLNVSRAFHVAAELDDGRKLVAGGHHWPGGTHYTLDSAEIYDPAQDTWSLIAPMNYRRYLGAAAKLQDGRVLVTGGSYTPVPSDYQTTNASSEIFDPATNLWSEVQPMTLQRVLHTAVLLQNGKVLVVGGFVYGTSTAWTLTELYDPASDTWTPAGDLTDGRWSHTATLLPDGRVLVVGGVNASGPLASVEIFTPDP
jgi:cysteine-rich repeat protein